MIVQETAAYKEGYSASVEANSNPELIANPYPLNSVEWKAWNCGWNSHYDPNWYK